MTSPSRVLEVMPAGKAGDHPDWEAMDSFQKQCQKRKSAMTRCYDTEL